MRSTPLAEARAEFSKLVDLALGGEPQRVTRRGREAVVIVSEAEWRKHAGSAVGGVPPDRVVPRYKTLADVLVALTSVDGFAEILDQKGKPSLQKKPLGVHCLDDIAE